MLLTVVTEAAAIATTTSGHCSTPIQSGQKTSLCQGHPTLAIGTTLKSPSTRLVLLPQLSETLPPEEKGSQGTPRGCPGH